jgi:hypothetical protein
MRRVLALLRRRDCTARQIADHAPAAISLNTLTKGGFLRAMEAQGLIHVCDWAPPLTSGNWAPIWRHGAGDSKPRPPRQSNADYFRRWYKKRGGARRQTVRRNDDAIRQVLRDVAPRVASGPLTLAGLLMGCNLEQNFAFSSGEQCPIKVGADERRYMVVTEKPSNAKVTGAAPTGDSPK